MPALVRFWHVKIHNCTYVGLTISPFAGKKSILNSILQCTKCSSWSSLDFLAAAVLRHQDFVITVYIAEEQQRNCREICGRCGQDFHLGFAPLFLFAQLAGCVLARKLRWWWWPRPWGWWWSSLGFPFRVFEGGCFFSQANLSCNKGTRWRKMH